MYWDNTGTSANNYTYYIPPNTMTKLTINAVYLDTHSGANTANSSYSVPYTGIYRINAIASGYAYNGTNFSSTGTIQYFDIQLRVNGNAYEDQFVFGTYPNFYNPYLFGTSSSTLIKLNAGDSISLYAYMTPYNGYLNANSGIQQAGISGHLVN